MESCSNLQLIRYLQYHIRCNCGIPLSYRSRLLLSHAYVDRLGVQRLRTLQEKKGAQAKAARRDIALLLEKGKVETARIKVENSEYC